MDVVALYKGKYGTMRARGETFTIASKADLGRWMAKAGSAEAKAAIRDATGAAEGVTPSQIAAELQEATGKSADVLKLANERIKELEQKVVEMTEALGAATVDVPEKAAPQEPDGEALKEPVKVTEETTEQAPATTPAETTRRRSRSK
ncbi:hypothetical protein BD1_10 [Octadecabacter Antarctic BD virus 1]|nr:hypothetical protein BD1_10 [Octadecabacter Antarctic BD virus 1]